MSTSRIYIDTSVIGGCFDVEFAEYSNRLFQAFYTKRWVAVVSDITFNELLNAPPRVRTQLDTLPESAIERVRLDEEANELAQKYLAAGILKTAQLGPTHNTLRLPHWNELRSLSVGILNILSTSTKSVVSIPSIFEKAIPY